MRDEQFELLIEKLEEIRCGLIDVETLLEKLVEQKGKELASDTTFKPVIMAGRLREEWRAVSPGGCKMVSMGDRCECHLCLIDRLESLAKGKVATNCKG